MNISILSIIFICFISSSHILSQTHPILMEGEFSDWESISYIYSDSIGDVPSGSVDFGGIKAINDGQFLYIYIELNYEINLQSFLNTTLYIDTDSDNSTGLNIDGLGAELAWNFAAKSGIFYFDGGNTVISQSDIGIVTSPTVTSETFEISFELGSKPDGINRLFTETDISILLKDDDSGDRLPDIGDSVTYQIQPVIGVPFDIIGLSKTDSKFLRFITWNVRRDGLFNESLFEQYSRILKAINPEIITFQEVYNHNAADLDSLMESILPSAAGEEWFTLIEENDIALASRFDIISSWLPNSGNRAFLVDLSSKYTKNLLVIGVHPPCCDNDAGRQNEVDAMMAFLRDAKQGIGTVQIEQDLPVIFAGDFNFVGDKRQLETMLTGDILDNSTWGVDFAPDWDGTFLTDAISRHTNSGHTYTWQNEFSDFSPGRLDFIIFTESVMELKKTFVLRTDELLPDSLTKFGLVESDTRLASDHLPVVADFFLELKDVSVEDFGSNLPKSLRLEQNYPNPFNPYTQIIFNLDLAAKTVLNVYDILGKEVAKLINGNLPKGSHSVIWNSQNMASGIYFYRLNAGDRSETKKMLLLK